MRSHRASCGTVTTSWIVTVLVTLFAACAHRPAEALAGYAYLSPVPSSELVSRWNNVAIRHGETIDPSTVDPALITVVGSQSGSHAGKLSLSDDSRTLVFTPTLPYAHGETVTVNLAGGTRASSGALLPAVSFHFDVARTDPVPRPVESYDELETPPADAAPTPIVSRRAAPTVTASGLPPNYPVMTLISMDHPDTGYVFLGPKTNTLPSPLLIIDNHMMPIFYRRAPYELLDFKMQPNGLLTYFDNSRRKHYAMDSTYTVVDSFAASNGYFADFHDLRVLPNGHVLLLIYDTQTVRMDLVVPGGDPDASVSGLVIQELDHDKNVVFQWRSWDHFEITDGLNIDLTAPYIDYVHGNALELDTDGNLLVSCRHFNEITKINHQTGDVMWRFGPNAKHNQFVVHGDPRGFGYQHDIRRLPNGDITLFDNADYLNPQVSRAVEYRLDEQTKEAWLVWEEWPSNSGYGNSNGSVQRRDNGSTMIGWGAGNVNPNVTELHSDGTKSLELQVASTTYRASRTIWETRRFVTDTKHLDFEGVRVGNNSSLSLNITNRIASPVQITSFPSLDSAFTVTTPTPLTLPPLGTVTVNVTFHPTRLGAFASTLYIRSETSTEIIAQDVNVEGQGVTGFPEVSLLSPNGGEVYAAGGIIDLKWLATEGIGEMTIDLELSRSGPGGPFETIAMGVPNTGTYSWPLTMPATTNAYVRVTAHAGEGQFAGDVSNAAFTINPVNLGVGDPPAAAFMLAPVSPNPTASRARIEYTVGRMASIRLTVSDLSGRTVAVLADGTCAPGRHHVWWDGSNGGERVAPGVYLLRYEAPGTSIVRRFALLR
jgi:hypothetical protein